MASNAIVGGRIVLLSSPGLGTEIAAMSQAWSVEDDDKLTRLWFANTPIEEIARAFGRSSIAIQTRGCKKFGRHSRERAAPTGTRYGWWTTERIEDLRSKWLGDYTIQGIADYFDVSDTAVRRAAKAYLGDDWANRKPRTSAASVRKIAPLAPIDAEHAAWYKMAKERDPKKRAVLEMKWRHLNAAL